jgi:threonine synthase
VAGTVDLRARGGGGGFGLIDRVPRLYACEPEARAPLAAAVATGRPFATVAAAPTVATGTACTTSSYRGVVALAESGGAACPVSDDDMAQGAEALAARGWWGEVSCGSALAALRTRVCSGPVPGPVVCVVASREAKNLPVASSGPDLPTVDGTWESLTAILGDHHGLRL